MLVRDGITGYVVPINDTVPMAERMIQLALDPDERRRFGREARINVERRYSYAILGERISAVYGNFAMITKSKRLQDALI